MNKDFNKHSEFAIVISALAPLRANAAESSEMVSECFRGETLSVLDVSDGWCRVRNTFDSYEGFVALKQLAWIDESSFLKCSNNLSYVKNTLHRDRQGRLWYFGSPMNPSIAAYFSIELSEFELSTNIDPSTENLIFLIEPFKDVPYRWGGRTISGTDCSGFVQTIFKMMGIALPRDASQQISAGADVMFFQEHSIGDLAFFENKAGKITHVGIITAPNEITHASGQVRLDYLDVNGIFVPDFGYSHSLRLIKRLPEFQH
jgi:hypothetical protein